MLSAERKNAIMDYLREKKGATVHELSRAVYVSEATVRRDLSEMENDGLLRRSHGGAVLLEREEGEFSMRVRQTENVPEKQAMARLALPLLGAGSSFFLDSSSSVRTLCALWDPAHITVVTTGVETAFYLSRRRGVEVILPGGVLRGLSGSLGGALCLRQIADFRADICLCSCGALSYKGELYESGVEAGEIKAAMLSRATTRILLCDHSKIGRTRAYRYASLGAWHILVTDRRPPDELADACRAAGVSVLYPGGENKIRNPLDRTALIC